MLEAMQTLPADQAPAATADGGPPRLTLTYDQRRKSRYRTRTDCGRELGWFLPRGEVLADGDWLLCTDGTRVLVRAAAEKVSEVGCDDALLMSRAAYHLGNRHVPLDIERGRLRYQRDDVLDDMLAGLGLAVQHMNASFNPENGAYHGKGAHRHAHGSDQHAHSHAGEHDHAHDHTDRAHTHHHGEH